MVSMPISCSDFSSGQTHAGSQSWLRTLSAADIQVQKSTIGGKIMQLWPDEYTRQTFLTQNMRHEYEAMQSSQEELLLPPVITPAGL